MRFMEYRTFRMPVVPVADGVELQLRPQYGHEDLGVPKSDYMRHYKILWRGKHFTYSCPTLFSHFFKRLLTLHRHVDSGQDNGTVHPCVRCDARHKGRLRRALEPLPDRKLMVDVCIRLPDGMGYAVLKGTEELDTPQEYIDAFEKRNTRRDIDGAPGIQSTD